MNSRFYRLRAAFFVFELIKLSGICILVGQVFFASMLASVFVFPFALIVLKQDIEREFSRQRTALWNEYKNAVVCMSGNLGAGYSLEKAFVMGLKDVAKQNGAKSMLGGCIKEIENSLACNVPLDKVLAEFSDRTGVQDIKEFSELIAASKKYGGNIVHMARRYAANVAGRQRLRAEIDALLASKKFEGRIMTVAPFVVVLYMRMTNGSYMQMLYETLLGRFLMAACLAATVLVIFITNKIVDIEV